MSDEIEPASGGRPWAKRLLRFGVSTAILGGMAIKTDWHHVADAFGGLDWPLAAGAFGVLLVAQVLSALRWQWLARPLGFDGPLRRYVGFYFVGMFFNLLLPTSVGGDAVRAIYLNAGSDRKVLSLLSVLLDRLSGLLVLLAVACIAAMVCPIALPLWVKLSVAGAATAATVGLLCVPWLAARTADEFADSKHRHVSRIGRLARSLQDALGVYRGRPQLILSSTLLSMAVQCSSVVQVGLLGLALGLDVPWSVYGVAAPMVALLTLLPISLNGMGVREAGMAIFLAPAGVPVSTALALAFLWFGIQTAAGLLGAGVYLAGRFPRPETPHDDAVRDYSDQGRARQRCAAA